jgi:hypothetical protein
MQQYWIRFLGFISSKRIRYVKLGRKLGPEKDRQEIIVAFKPLASIAREQSWMGLKHDMQLLFATSFRLISDGLAISHGRPSAENLIPIRIDVEFENRRVKDAFTWNVDGMLVFNWSTENSVLVMPDFQLVCGHILAVICSVEALGSLRRKPEATGFILRFEKFVEMISIASVIDKLSF